MLRALRRELGEQRERADRLEIAVRRQALKLDELATDLERLSDRLCGLQGRVLGGRKRPAELPLEAIPHGDKAALRRALLKNKPTDDTEH